MQPTEPTTVEEDQTPASDVEVSEETDETQGEEELIDTPDGEGGEAFEKRFTQFQGETPEEYIKSLEEGYNQTSKEGMRLRTELQEKDGRLNQIMAQVAQDPELARKLNLVQTGQAPSPAQLPISQDPAYNYFRGEFQRKMQEEYDEFVDEHPELRGDVDLQTRVNTKLAAYRQAVMQTEGRQISMREGLDAAYTMLGMPITQTNEEATRMALKNTASQTRKPAGVPQAPPRQRSFSEEQLEWARRNFPGLSDEELEKKMTEALTSTQPH